MKKVWIFTLFTTKLLTPTLCFSTVEIEKPFRFSSELDSISSQEKSNTYPSPKSVLKQINKNYESSLNKSSSESSHNNDEIQFTIKLFNGEIEHYPLDKTRSASQKMKKLYSKTLFLTGTKIESEKKFNKLINHYKTVPNPQTPLERHMKNCVGAIALGFYGTQNLNHFKLKTYLDNTNFLGYLKKSEDGDNNEKWRNFVIERQKFLSIHPSNLDRNINNNPSSHNISDNTDLITLNTQDFTQGDAVNVGEEIEGDREGNNGAVSIRNCTTEESLNQPEISDESSEGDALTQGDESTPYFEGGDLDLPAEIPEKLQKPDGKSTEGTLNSICDDEHNEPEGDAPQRTKPVANKANFLIDPEMLEGYYDPISLDDFKNYLQNTLKPKISDYFNNQQKEDTQTNDNLDKVKFDLKHHFITDVLSYLKVKEESFLMEYRPEFLKEFNLLINQILSPINEAYGEQICQDWDILGCSPALTKKSNSTGRPHKGFSLTKGMKGIGKGFGKMVTKFTGINLSGTK